MTKQFGSLEFVPTLGKSDWLAAPVTEALGLLPDSREVLVSKIDPALSDTAAFCEQYEIKMEQAANCVIVEGKRGEDRKLAAVVVLAHTRADINKTVKSFLDVRKVSFASMEKAVAESNMEFGAITPVGVPADWPILIDQAVIDSDYVIVGSGIRGSKLLVSGSWLAILPNVTVIENLAKVPE